MGCLERLLYLFTPGFPQVENRQDIIYICPVLVKVLKDICLMPGKLNSINSTHYNCSIIRFVSKMKKTKALKTVSKLILWNADEEEGTDQRSIRKRSTFNLYFAIFKACEPYHHRPSSCNRKVSESIPEMFNDALCKHHILLDLTETLLNKVFSDCLDFTREQIKHNPTELAVKGLNSKYKPYHLSGHLKNGYIHGAS